VLIWAFTSRSSNELIVKRVRVGIDQSREEIGESMVSSYDSYLIANITNWRHKWCLQNIILINLYCHSVYSSKYIQNTPRVQRDLETCLQLWTIILNSDSVRHELDVKDTSVEEEARTWEFDPGVEAEGVMDKKMGVLDIIVNSIKEHTSLVDYRRFSSSNDYWGFVLKLVKELGCFLVANAQRSFRLETPWTKLKTSGGIFLKEPPVFTRMTCELVLA